MNAPRSERPTLLWMTNLAAPYRLPVWRQLSNSFDLRILLTEDSSSPESSVRSRDWFGSNVGEPWSTVDANLLRPTVAGHSLPTISPKTRNLVKRSDAAVVLGAWEAPAYWQLASQARRQNVRTVGFYESTVNSHSHPSGVIALARQHFFRKLDAVVVPGTAARETLLGIGVKPDRVRVGFNAVDVNAFHQAAIRVGERRFPPGHRFIYVGQLIPRKNVDGLIRAFALCRNPDDLLTIVGEGTERPRLTKLATDLSVNNHIEFRGETAYSALPAIMAAHDTLVLPSTEEVWGLVVNEALATGASCVVSALAGVAPSVRNMNGVELCNPDPSSIAAAMAGSRRAWRGRHRDPEILKHTPEAFAEVFSDAITSTEADSLR